MLSVSGLSIYPLKSCRGIELTVSDVAAFGLEGDRRWMVVDAQGVMLTQRKLTSMCLIQAELTQARLVLKHSAMQDLIVNIPDGRKISQVKVWHDQCHAYDAGDEAAHWLSQLLATKCRLVYFPEDEFRQVDLNFAQAGDKTAFSDGFPLLLISQASLDELNSRLIKPVSMSRFRPNIVIQGCAPFAEDNWKIIKIGEIIYRLVKPCSRCVIPGINIETAEREAEPVKTLSTFRKFNNKVFFGQNMIAEGSGKIAVDMSVEIIE